MTQLLAMVCMFLFLNLLAGLVRVWKGPTMADSLLAAQLIGTTGAAILIVVSAMQDLPSLIDAALVLALLAAVTLLVFSCRIWKPKKEDLKTVKRVRKEMADGPF